MAPYARYLAAVLVGLLLVPPAASQSRRVVTHSPSIHRGAHSQSAFIAPTPRQRVFPGSVIHVPTRTRRSHHPFHHGFHHRRHHVHVHGPTCHFTAGHYVTHSQQVWVPDHYVRRYVPPQYEFQYRDGRKVRVLVAPGYHKQVLVKGHYETRPVRVYVPPRWSCGF